MNVGINWGNFQSKIVLTLLAQISLTNILVFILIILLVVDFLSSFHAVAHVFILFELGLFSLDFLSSVEKSGWIEVGL